MDDQEVRVEFWQFGIKKDSFEYDLDREGKRMVKKLLIILAIVLVASIAQADVQFTVNWNQSPDAVVTLDRQEVIYDGTIKATPAFLNPGDPHSYIWIEPGVNIADVVGKIVTVSTFNTQGLNADVSIAVGTPPIPATGMTIFLLQQ